MRSALATLTACSWRRRRRCRPRPGRRRVSREQPPGQQRRRTSLDGSLNRGCGRPAATAAPRSSTSTPGQILYQRNAEHRPAAGIGGEAVHHLHRAASLRTDATADHSLLGVGPAAPASTYHGTLYLRGGGDPTFGSAGFDRANYGTGADVQQLVADLVHGTGIRALKGNVVADESFFDSLRGTPATGYQPSTRGRGRSQRRSPSTAAGQTPNGRTCFPHPAVAAGQQLVAGAAGRRGHGAARDPGHRRAYAGHGDDAGHRRLTADRRR